MKTDSDSGEFGSLDLAPSGPYTTMNDSTHLRGLVSATQQAKDRTICSSAMTEEMAMARSTNGFAFTPTGTTHSSRSSDMPLFSLGDVGDLGFPSAVGDSRWFRVGDNSPARVSVSSPPP